MSEHPADRAYAEAMMEHLLELAATDAGLKVAILAAANGLLVADALTQGGEPAQAHLAAAVARFARQAQASLRDLLTPVPAQPHPEGQPS